MYVCACVRGWCEVNDSRSIYRRSYTKITPYAGALAIVATGYDPGRPGRSQPQPLRRRSTARTDALQRKLVPACHVDTGANNFTFR
jgi:hypothetical protein